MKPIIMGAESVRAILEGRKTMTRRVVNKRTLERFRFSPSGELLGSFNESHPEWEIYPTVDDAPYRIGDLLWVRETWAEPHYWTNDIDAETPIYRECDRKEPIKQVKWKSPMFMPRWASRITLEITDIRVKRVQDISEEDAKAEGIKVLPLQDESDPSAWYQYAPGIFQARSATKSYELLWNSLNARRGYPWESNPWVWVISFKRVSEC